MFRPLLILVFCAILFSQSRWSAEAMAVDGKTLIKVNMSLDLGFHVYGIEPVDGPIATAFYLGDEKIAAVQRTPKGTPHFDEGFQTEVMWYKGDDYFILLVPRLLNADETVSVEFQICTETYCHTPKREALAVSHTMFEHKPEWLTLKKAERRDFAAQKSDGFFAYLGIAFGAGFLALLTPCVFPMVPITVSFFTKNGEETKAKAVRLGFVYGLGIVLIFTLFGFAIAQIFGATGVQNIAANPWVNLAIGLLFVVFALSLFGMFEIRLPNALVNKTHQLGNKQGYVGVLFAGVAFALVTFTCTAPFFGGLIAQAAQGEWFYPLFGMAAFSTAFASPFVLLAIFPQWIAQMPKSGSWLHATKIVMAFVEVAAAIKFFSQADLVWNLEILTRPFMLVLWVVLFGLSGLYLLGMFKLSNEDNVEKIGIVRLFNAMLFLVLALYLASGINGRALQADLDSYLPPSNYGQEQAAASAAGLSHTTEERWIERFSEAKAEAKRSGKKMFVDFTGKTCTNCRWMEKNIFTKPEIEAQFENYVLVRLWTDFGEDKELNQELQLKHFKTVALPFYAIMDADETVYATFAGMTRDADTFIAFLSGK